MQMFLGYDGLDWTVFVGLFVMHVVILLTGQNELCGRSGWDWNGKGEGGCRYNIRKKGRRFVSYRGSGEVIGAEVVQKNEDRKLKSFLR